MSIRDKIYDAMGKYEDNGDLGECVSGLEDLLDAEGVVYEIFTDEEVFNSCGFDIYYVSVSWIENNKLNVCGSRITSH